MDSNELRQEQEEGWQIQYKPDGDFWRLWRKGNPPRKLNGYMIRTMQEKKMLIRVRDHSSDWQRWEMV